MKQRMRQLFPHNGVIEAEERIPRGWITPQGQFLKTKEHWASIYSHFRKVDDRTKTKAEIEDEDRDSERAAQLAYSLGWISVGHAGKLNAVAHEKVFQVSLHPAVLTLQKLLAEVPYATIPIETQIGAYLPSEGVHTDYALKEYDVSFLIKRGKLKPQIA
jgi:hypothetical protein